MPVYCLQATTISAFRTPKSYPKNPRWAWVCTPVYRWKKNNQSFILTSRPPRCSRHPATRITLDARPPPLPLPSPSVHIMSSNVPPYGVDLIVAAAVRHSVSSIFEIESRVRGCHGHPPRKRECRSITEIYDCLGPHYFRRAYRMTYESFWILHHKTSCLIRLYAVLAIRRKQKKAAQQLLVGGVPPPIPNGRISTSV